MAAHYFLGRQPIFDSNLQAIGYELLYRSESQSVSDVDPDNATSNVILNLLESDLNQIAGKLPAHINITKHFLINNILPKRKTTNIVLELQDDINEDDQTIESIKKIKSSGYLIALDNFNPNKKFYSILQLADFVKLDIQSITIDEMKDTIANLRQFPVKLIALKVETPEDFDKCKTLGFDYYQGYFLQRPQTLKNTRVSQNRLAALRMLQELNRPNISIDKLQELLKTDVSLSYKLLRYINSSAFGLQNDIRDIRHAIVYLGLQEFQRWVNLVVLANISDKPSELMTSSLIRGKMCELLARKLRKGEPETAFLVGLFSLLDVIMDTPLSELFKSLPLHRDIKKALLESKGIYSDHMYFVLNYEKANWSSIKSKNITQATITDIYSQAIRWADDAMNNITSK